MLKKQWIKLLHWEANLRAKISKAGAYVNGFAQEVSETFIERVSIQERTW